MSPTTDTEPEVIPGEPVYLYTNAGPGRRERRYARKHGEFVHNAYNVPARKNEDGTYTSWE